MLHRANEKDLKNSNINKRKVCNRTLKLFVDKVAAELNYKQLSMLVAQVEMSHFSYTVNYKFTSEQQ